MGKLFFNFTILVLILCYSVVIDLGFFKHSNQYEISFLNIGQGDATLIRTPQNCSILIDGGPRTALSQKIKDKLPILDKTIDLVVLTHPHLDHFAGILELKHRYQYKNVWLTGVQYPSKDYEALLEKINSDSKVNLKYITKPESYFLCGIKIDILMPFDSLLGQTEENVNNSSIVLLLDIKGTKILLSGDAELEEETIIIDRYSELISNANIKIFKAGHHGSRTSNTLELLKLIQPEFMVISAGESNSYGHPHFETIQKANSLGIKILRTDQLKSEEDISFFF